MTFPSIRYSALRQEDDDDRGNSIMTDKEGNKVEYSSGLEYDSGIEYGCPEGTFKSPFTYAKYNELDRMGYEDPKRSENMVGKRHSHFTYSNNFDEEEKEVTPMNVVELIIYTISVLFVFLTLPFSLLFVVKFMSTSERLVVFRLGRAQKTRGPGAAFVVPCIDTTYKISTSITAFNVPPLQVITIDRGLVELGATVFLRIRDPIAAVCSIQDRNSSTRTLANTMLHRYISKKQICEITNSQNRRILAANLKDELGSVTCTYGVEITDIELSDPKVIKEGENMGLLALTAVAKSDAGRKLWEVIAPHVEEFARDVAENNSSEAANQSPAHDESVPEQSTHTEQSLVDFEPNVDVDQLITTINMAIDEQLTNAVGRIFQINCSDISPIFIDLKHLPGVCGKGVIPNADVVFELSQHVFMKIIAEELSPINAYMQGSLKLTGQIQDALTLKS
ncbi:hypothetical protein KIN20_036283 [Parelaphostrongylus tenuis]|uniref:Band 7 domain-containing protein n=1 Tax=Parelaphostrongylus tenuis TaxID=148309 RepID=A0AAD5WKI5_PARTN|nr:hypothetical protein KIN20_036283 [Parelaphostrongylus tenuis]